MGLLNYLTGSENEDRFKEARELNESAEQIVQWAQEDFETAQNSCQRTLKHLDLQKQKIYKGSFAIFATTITRVKHTNFSFPKELAELDKYTDGMMFFYPYVDINIGIWESSWGRTIGKFGSLTGCGIIGMFGWNAYMSKKSQIALDNAKSTYAEAEVVVEQLEMASEVCGYIEARAKMFSEVLDKLNSIFVTSVLNLKKITEEKGTDFDEYDRCEQQAVATAVTLAKSIKAVLDIAILNKDGSLSRESKVLALGMSKELQIPCNADSLGNDESLPEDEFASELCTSESCNQKLIYCDSYDTIIDIISKNTGVCSSDINMYTSFSELNMNNMQLDKIVISVEKKFRINVSKRKLENIKTVEELTDYVVEQLDDAFREAKYVVNQILESEQVQEAKELLKSFFS